METKNRVLITGIGVISCIGNDVNTFWNNALKGSSGIKKIKKFDTSSLKVKIAGTVDNFDASLYEIGLREKKRYSLTTQYTLGASMQALKDAELLNSPLTKNLACIMGTGMGNFDIIESTLFSFAENDYKGKVSPFFIPLGIPNSIAGINSIHYKLGGPSFTLNTACASSNHAIISAFNMIKQGYCDIALTGGSESTISPIVINGFSIINALSKEENKKPSEVSRPFDSERSGFVLSEGSAILILEKEESALKRNAKIYGEVLGGFMNSEAYHITSPDPNAQGIIRCFDGLLKKNPNIKKEDINYINSHGTSTPIGDRVEQLAIESFFGKKWVEENIKINASKSILGHSLGAAGGLEAVLILKSLESGYLHPNINYDNPSPDSNVKSTTIKKSLKYPIKIALSNSFGFGGHNAIIAFQKYSNN